MNKVFRFLLLILLLLSTSSEVFAVKYATVQYDIPIDYSKIDKSALANQANLLFNEYVNMTDKNIKEEYVEPLLKMYMVLSKMEPFNPRNFSCLGVIYDDLDNDVEAKSNFFKATNIDPSYKYASYCFGNFYYKRGYYRKALSKFKMSEGIGTPYSYDWHVKMGSIYEKLGNFEQALVQYQSAYSENESEELYNKILLLEDLNTKNMLYHK